MAERSSGLSGWFGRGKAAPGLKRGFVGNIAALTRENDDYRRVLYTGRNLQLVLMTLQPGEEIGQEVHPDIDQFLRIEEGEGVVTIDGQLATVRDDFAILVPAGARHNVLNTGSGPLRLYTLYGPPEHAMDVVHPGKADEDHRHFDGRTSE